MSMGWGLTVIEVCDANPACTESLFALEQEYPFVSVLETACMSQCDLCARRAYVFMDNEIVEAPDVPALLEMLRQRLQQSADLDAMD
jgi:uncharacterized protein YuzB (UPF0349 family)